MMNPQAQEIFDRVTMMKPKELLLPDNKEDLEFLRSRRAYLRPEQEEIFKDCLTGTKDMSDTKRKEFLKTNKEAMAKAQKEAKEKAEKAKKK